jgi:hypothetical protein
VLEGKTYAKISGNSDADKELKRAQLKRVEKTGQRRQTLLSDKS